MRSIFLFSTIIFVSTIKAQIPGCPDINFLSESANDLEGEKLDRIKCVCASDASQNSSPIEVNCVFGASFDDLSNVLAEISNLNRTVKQINLNHISVSPNSTTLMELFSHESSSKIEGIEIKNCHGSALDVSDNSTNEIEQLNELRVLTIENCGLTQIPEALIRRTKQLESISLNNNKIEFITTNQLKASSNSLQFLDLTENLISDIEINSFKQLKQLRTLLIGEHNFANTTLIEEIAQLENLETLDLTRIDGINSVDQLAFLDGNHIERLVLTGCNIKAINASSFSSLTKLKELDMRVNLIESLELDSFLGLSSLERISLAGNFLRDSEIRADRWGDLTNVTQLDLGWNELKILRSNSFGPQIGTNMHILSLRSNEKLAEIEENAFLGLKNLQNLNISGSGLKQIGSKSFNDLNSLEFLDLSNNNLSFIDKQAFESMKTTLTNLNLANNKLKSLDVGVFSVLSNLTELNLSGNEWLCDQKMLKVVDWIRHQYLSAAKTSKSFLLSNAGSTICERPYKFNGKSIMDLKPEDVKEEYNEKMDTTTVPSLQSENITEMSVTETTTLIDFSKLILNIGEKNDTFDVINNDDDKGKPTYDINSIKYGQKPVDKSNNTWISAVVVIGLLILTVSSVLLVIKRKINARNRHRTESQGQTNSQEQPSPTN